MMAELRPLCAKRRVPIGSRRGRACSALSCAIRKGSSELDPYIRNGIPARRDWAQQDCAPTAILRQRLLFPLLAVLLLAGCQSPDTGRAASADVQADARHSGEITPGSPAYNAWRTKARSGRAGKTEADVITEGEILQLPKFVVSEKGFVDYGFSIITNEEVLRGKPVKRVQVGVVLPGSIADRYQLTTGMKIIAIDNILVTDLHRDDLLHLLYEREAGEHVRLLVLSRAIGLLPTFVDLAGPPVPLK